MKKIRFHFVLVINIILFNGCSNAQIKQGSNLLLAHPFSEQISKTSHAQIVDVRTPQEFSKGHLINAINIDWNGTDFDKQMAIIDKAKPVFVYCLSGGRSSIAASKMRSDGFNQVFELSGGIMKWRAANLPEATSNIKVSACITQQQFNALVNSDKLVLIDFYADWCAPCKKMKPYLDQISNEMADRVVVIRINADENQTLCKELKIDALPVLQLYKSNALAWTHSGYIGKEEVVNQLR